MSTLNRRRFSLLGIGGFASVAVVGCGNEVGNEVAIQPTQITDVPGAPPTLADMATPGGVSEEEDAGTGGGAEAPAGEEVTVESLDTLRYDPEQLTASPGSVITMTNVGVVQHNFVVDDLGGEVIPLLNGGESASWTVPADAPLGDHVFYCSVPGHAQAGMDGTLSLVEASAAAPSGEGEASPAAEGATPAAAEGTPPPAEDPAAGAPAGGGEPIALDAVDPFVWSETALTASAGTVITVTNTGFLPHNFAIDEFGGVLVDLPSNLTTGDWTVPADATPGEYVFYCSIPGHRQSGMEGVLTIA